MIYRTAAIFIVLFWLTMTGLLVHQELRPGDSALLDVPVAHVVKLIFHHRQRSSLNIFSGPNMRLGQLVLEPSINDQMQSRDLKFYGDLQLFIPGGKRERVSWKGELNMDKALNTTRFQLNVNTSAASGVSSQIVVVPAENLARYELVSNSGMLLEQQDYTLDERGARAALEQIGIDPSMLPVAAKQRVEAAPTIKARQSSLTVHDDRMDTYLVTMESNGQTLFECHVDQLGRIVHVSTLLGYTLVPDDITP